MEQDLFQQARQLIKSGHASDARRILTKLIDADPHNVTVWFWLAEAMPDDDHRISVLEQCLRFNPESRQTQFGLEKLLNRQKSAQTLSETPKTLVEPNPFTVPADALSSDPQPPSTASSAQAQNAVQPPKPDRPVQISSNVKTPAFINQPKQSPRQDKLWIYLLVLLGLVLVLGILYILTQI